MISYKKKWNLLKETEVIINSTKTSFMKIFLISISIFFYSNLFSQYVSAPSCTTLNFSSFNGIDIHTDFFGIDCPYSFYQINANSRSVDNWYLGNGTPQIVDFPSDRTQDFAQFFNIDASYGETIFTNFDFFTNTGYSITASLRAAQGTGTVNFYTGSGLTERIPGGCGETTQYPTFFSTVYNPTITNTSWQTFSQSFDFPDNFHSGSLKYQQLEINPAKVSGPQFFLNLQYVQICYDCASQKIYPGDVLIPTGTSKYGSIYTGSTYGGTNPTTIVSSSITTLDAFNAIYMMPETNITPSGNGSFTAEIVDCSNSQALVNNHTIANSQSKVLIQTNNNTILYPNPVHSILHLDLSNQSENIQSIRILNVMGNVMKIISINGNPKNYDFFINMIQLPVGVYFIQLQSKTKVFTQEVVKY